MQIELTSGQQTQLSQIAAQQGKAVEQLAQEVFSQGLAAEAHFLAAVRIGQDAARRGDFIEAPEVWAAVEQVL